VPIEVLRGNGWKEWCKDGENTLRRLFEFLVLDPGKREGEFRRVEYHVIGNGIRLDMTSEIRLDERWREIVTEKDIRVFDTVAREMNRRYGYE
jgi:hypothetical protein